MCACVPFVDDLTVISPSSQSPPLPPLTVATQLDEIKFVEPAVAASATLNN